MSAKVARLLMIKEDKPEHKVKVFWVIPEVDGHPYVLCSAVNNRHAVETFAFACTKDGKIINWSELSISRRGFGPPEKILKEAGYEIVEE